MKLFFYQTFFLLHLSLSFSQTVDNTELQTLFNADQNSRMEKNIDWSALSKQDSLREIRVFALIKENKIITAKDYYNSAMIFQHGRDTIASGMAAKQMKKALELDPTLDKWLLAAAIDRDLRRRNKPQIYGTQYIKVGPNASWEKYKMDTIQITDEERKYYGVESLAMQKISDRNKNLISLTDYFSTIKSIDEAIEFIKEEKMKGCKSAYNISEWEIDRFAYQLMNSNKDQEALKLFKLNAELFPGKSNTYDSYGECLMKLNKRKEGINAYKKALALNPDNIKARKIVAQKKT